MGSTFCAIGFYLKFKHYKYAFILLKIKVMYFQYRFLLFEVFAAFSLILRHIKASIPLLRSEIAFVKISVKSDSNKRLN